MRNNRGVSLIELIIVIVIIGILASVAAPVIQGVRMKMMAAEAINTLGVIRVAEQLYYNKYHVYPPVVDLKATGYLNENIENGVYFSHRSYEYIKADTADGKTYILCTPAKSEPTDSSKADEVNSVWCGHTITGNSYIAIELNSGHYCSNIPGVGISNDPPLIE